MVQITCVHAKSLQSCPTLCNTMHCSPPGSSVHGSLQVRILEWVAVPSSRGSFWPRDWTCVSQSPALVGGFFTPSATWEALIHVRHTQLIISNLSVLALVPQWRKLLKTQDLGMRFRWVVPIPSQAARVLDRLSTLKASVPVAYYTDARTGPQVPNW